MTRAMNRAMRGSRARRRAAATQRGATLVELMVAILIAMIMTLAIFSVLATSEGRKRSLTSVNDINQAGNVALYQLDRAIRSAGTGFNQTANYAYGCELLAYSNTLGTQLLPRTTALPSPFDALNPGTANMFRLAPVLIVQDGAQPAEPPDAPSSDALIVMAGSAGFGESPMQVESAASANQLSLPNTVGYRANDLLLLAEKQPAGSGGPLPCMVTQASAGTVTGTATSLPLAGNYHPTASIDGRALTDYSDLTFVAGLGQTPSLQVLGVGDHDVLYGYDLLQIATPPLRAQAEGVYVLRALYGLDTNGDNAVDTWARPTGNYSPASLGDGSVAASERLRQIKAIRLGLVMRTSLPERDEVAPAALTLFPDADAGLPYQVDLTGDARRFRYRTLDTTIPLRNNLILPTS